MDEMSRASGAWRGRTDAGWRTAHHAAPIRTRASTVPAPAHFTRADDLCTVAATTRPGRRTRALARQLLCSDVAALVLAVVLALAMTGARGSATRGRLAAWLAGLLLWLTVAGLLGL